jgi:hypothetical protein
VCIISPVQDRFGGSAADVSAMQVVSFAPTSANGLTNEAFAANPLKVGSGAGSLEQKSDGQTGSAQSGSAGRSNHHNHHKPAPRQIGYRIALDDRGGRERVCRQISCELARNAAAPGHPDY